MTRYVTRAIRNWSALQQSIDSPLTPAPSQAQLRDSPSRNLKLRIAKGGRALEIVRLDTK